MTDLFSLSKFLPFLDLFQKESVKVEACKSILFAYRRYKLREMACNCQSLHDDVLIVLVLSIVITCRDQEGTLKLLISAVRIREAREALLP